MRVALINEGTYPYHPGGVSTWCDQLVRGLSDVDWTLVSVVSGDAAPLPPPLPANVRALLPVPIWGAARPARRPAERAAARMCRGMLGSTPADRAVFAEGLRELAFLAAPARRWRPSGRGAGRHPLAGVKLAEILLDAWAGAPDLPKLTLRDADRAALFLEHAVRPLAARPGDVDLCHANAGGMAALVALGAHWREEIPFALTEHGVYLRERYFSTAGFSPGVKAALLRFHRALARVTYAEAALILPVSGFNKRWELRHGAPAERIHVVPNGVDPERFAPLHEEPETPTIAWVGRIDPLKDVETLIRAFGYVRAWLPTARLHLAGPVPAGNKQYADKCRTLAADLGVAEAVDFAGPVACSRDAFALGHVVALSSISEGMPYTVIEAMMCGRATVSTDVGGVADVVGEAGIVVPPRDPEAFAQACLRVLTDPVRRAELGAAARERARAQFTLDRCLSTYRGHYHDLVGVTV
jgi:glycosyltransferase involved in cell wall biosynthesis